MERPSVPAMADDAERSAIEAAEALFAELGGDEEEEAEAQEAAEQPGPSAPAPQPSGLLPAATRKRKAEATDALLEKLGVQRPPQGSVSEVGSAHYYAQAGKVQDGYIRGNAKDLPHAKLASCIRGAVKDDEGWVRLSTVTGSLSMKLDLVLLLCRERKDLFVINFDERKVYKEGSGHNKKVRGPVAGQEKVKLTDKGQCYGMELDEELVPSVHQTFAGEMQLKSKPEDNASSEPSARAIRKWKGTRQAEIAKFVELNHDANGTLDTQSIQAFLSIRVEHLEALLNENTDLFEVVNKGEQTLAAINAARYNGRFFSGDRMRIKLTKLGQECAKVGPPGKRHKYFGPPPGMSGYGR